MKPNKSGENEVLFYCSYHILLMAFIDRMIPVIDIKDGVAVGAKEGVRDKYMELESVLTDSCDPVEIAKLYKKLGFKSIYVADLDGIMKSAPNIDLLKNIKWKSGLKVMADIGTWSEDEIMSIEMAGITPILATETFTSLDLLQFPRKFALSLDIRGSRLLCGMNCDLTGFLKLIEDSPTIEKVIIIDLEKVGMSSGPNIELCRKIIEGLPGKKIYYGGGIRYLIDVAVLLKAGISGVLVGSALHEGRVNINDLTKE